MANKFDSTTVRLPLTFDVPYLIPGPGQIVAIIAVAVFGAFGLFSNLTVLVGRIRAVKKGFPLTGFDCLVLNLLLSNFLLVLLVYPYDVIASVFTSIFPIIGCWTVVTLMLHQLIAYASLIITKSHPSVNSSSNSNWPRYVSLYVPTTGVWLFALLFYTPVAHSHWVIDVDIYTCGLESDSGLLHDSMWYFWIPFSVALLALMGIVLLNHKSRVSISVSTHPSNTSEATVRWSDITLQESHSTNPDVYSSLNPLYFDCSPSCTATPGPSQASSMAATPPTYTANGHKELESTNSTSSRVDLLPLTEVPPLELRLEHLRICMMCLAVLLVFVGPYALITLLFHLSTEHKFSVSLVFWDIGFTWMSVKPVFEPLLLIMASPTYRSTAMELVLYGFRR